MYARAAQDFQTFARQKLHENYDLLLKYSLEITAETSVRVIHNLIAPPGVSLRALRTVYSHPVALNQCLDFFASHPRIERTPFYDTAGSVKMIMEQRPADAGAIASELAAQIYGAHILSWLSRLDKAAIRRPRESS